MQQWASGEPGCRCVARLLHVEARLEDLGPRVLHLPARSRAAEQQARIGGVGELVSWWIGCLLACLRACVRQPQRTHSPRSGCAGGDATGLRAGVLRACASSTAHTSHAAGGRRAGGGETWEGHRLPATNHAGGCLADLGDELGRGLVLVRRAPLACRGYMQQGVVCSKGMASSKGLYAARGGVQQGSDAQQVAGSGRLPRRSQASLLPPTRTRRTRAWWMHTYANQPHLDTACAPASRTRAVAIAQQRACVCVCVCSGGRDLRRRSCSFWITSSSLTRRGE